MKTVNVSGLKNNPSEALRQSHEDIVLVMNRNQPDTLCARSLRYASCIRFPHLDIGDSDNTEACR